MLRNLAITLLLAATFSLSLFYQSYQDPLQFPVISLLAAAFLLALARKQFTIPSSPPVFILIALTLLTTLTFALSTIPFSSQIALCIFCALPLTFFSFSLVIARSNATKQSTANTGLPRFARNGDAVTITILLTPLAFLSFWAIAQSITGTTRATGPLLDPNMLAILLTLGLICTAGIALYKRTTATALLTLLLFAGLISTASRSGLISASIGLITLIITTRPSLQRKQIVYLTGAILIILALFGGALWHQIGDFNFTTPSITDRLALWHATWQMTLAHPLTGTGPGTFYLYYPSFRGTTDQSLGHFAHNDLLQMAAEMGFAAPLIIYAFFAAIFLRTLSALRATTDSAERFAIITPFAALLTVAIQAHMNYPLFMLPVMITCGILLALWHSATVIALNTGTTIVIPKLPARLALSFSGFILILCILGLSFTASAGLYNMHKAETATDPQTALIALGGAERLGPLSFIDPEVKMAGINIDLLTKTENIKSPKLREELLAQSTRLLDTAAYWNPAWAEIDNLRGDLEKIRGSKALMVIDWKEAIRKNPQSFDARQKLADALRAEGRNDDALKIVEDGLNYQHPIAYREWASTFIRKSIKQP